MGRVEPGLAVIPAVGADLGLALARHWVRAGWRIAGTYRTRSEAIGELEAGGAALVHCDFSVEGEAERAAAGLGDAVEGWKAFVCCVGDLKPIGRFGDVDPAAWRRSLAVNALNPLSFLHALLPRRVRDLPLGPLVAFFAGGGTNDAPTHYSAYTASKILLIKMVELIQAEHPDLRAAIIGPGLVDTKIHAPTMVAREAAGPTYERVRTRLEAGEIIGIDRVVDAFDWLLGASRETVGGRNFSVASDRLGSPRLDAALEADPDMYKLRRHGNSWQP